ncbi:RNA deprotection pyrophosphohydrolase [Jeotgalibacillus soli]|uniref:7,8-dihydro-8-oxoguanine-triphosphatase n=1 Tax=Jeotgalibacillus soli TaxID=889306 RepID=A0A0C2V4I2_9BACL|nr:nucleoside triphosphatase YtkD [Jeotgalibacillus soli]KIL43937.1 7,8-dihydro-8-oxoguanine-triphosphatase [Jeotgalibacillus soli]
MYTFLDYYQKKVEFSFEKEPFLEPAKHVWIVTRYQGKWVLTHHKKRGLEFPGGKVEEQESLEQAARREVKEEIGGEVDLLHYVAQYKVEDQPPIIKAIFFAEVTRLVNQPHYFETNGPCLVSGDLLAERHRDTYSFIMKDDVLIHVLNYWHQQIKKEKTK